VYLVEEMFGSLDNVRVAVLGTAFKPNSDDVRDSPALDIAARLFSAGAEVAVYDPEANQNSAKRFPRLTYCSSLVEAVTEAEVVLVLTEWDEFKRLTPESISDLVSGKRIIDGRNILSADRWQDAGWMFRGLGRRVEVEAPILSA
jgi:UDPglucose 6-dehydrogenase